MLYVLGQGLKEITLPPSAAPSAAASTSLPQQPRTATRNIIHSGVSESRSRLASNSGAIRTMNDGSKGSLERSAMSYQECRRGGGKREQACHILSLASSVRGIYRLQAPPTFSSHSLPQTNYEELRFASQRASHIPAPSLFTDCGSVVPIVQPKTTLLASTQRAPNKAEKMKLQKAGLTLGIVLVALLAIVAPGANACQTIQMGTGTTMRIHARSKGVQTCPPDLNLRGYGGNVPGQQAEHPRLTQQAGSLPLLRRKLDQPPSTPVRQGREWASRIAEHGGHEEAYPLSPPPEEAWRQFVPQTVRDRHRRHQQSLWQRVRGRLGRLVGCGRRCHGASRH